MSSVSMYEIRKYREQQKTAEIMLANEIKRLKEERKENEDERIQQNGRHQKTNE